MPVYPGKIRRPKITNSMEKITLLIKTKQKTENDRLCTKPQSLGIRSQVDCVKSSDKDRRQVERSLCECYVNRSRGIIGECGES